MINLRILGMVAVVVVIAAFSIKIYNVGYQNAEGKCAKEKLESVTRAVKQVQKINAENTEIAQAYWQQKLAEKPAIRHIEKRILKYVQVNNSDTCKLDDDELRIINDLIDIANGNNRPKPNPRMPPPGENRSK